jgi:hypothetical protein
MRRRVNNYIEDIQWAKVGYVGSLSHIENLGDVVNRYADADNIKMIKSHTSPSL